MQCDDGGWGAFDRNNNKAILTHIPFADFNALLDPSTSDVTARSTTRSIRAEEQRLVLLSELFGPSATASAIDDVMKTGHVGADYIENVLRYRRRLEPGPAPLRLGDPALDSIVLPEPDLGVYDDIGARRPLRDDGYAHRDREEETT